MERFFCILIFSLFILRGVLAADPAQLVQGLPGQPKVGFKQYAGQVEINATAGRALFYWFFEADHSNSSELPVVLWLNGGPGCSSVGAGALAEIGPFRTNDAGTGLFLNPFSWNKAANLIFLEVPYNTGFSYTNLYSDGGFWSDNQTAVDSLLFLIEFFSKFPELKQNEFFITGESFAGHFIPTLATQILVHNDAQRDALINFKGFAIGNPSTDDAYDVPGNYETLYSHSVISKELYEGWKRFCNSSLKDDASLERCGNIFSQISRLTQYLTRYNIYAPACNDWALSEAASTKIITSTSDNLTNEDPCKPDSVTPYLNLPEVQAALHVETRPVRWRRCNPDIDRSYLPVDKNRSLLPVYKELFGRGLKILIYSGDLDTVVSTLSTRSWIEALNLTIVTPWYAWNHTNQVGGWSEVYSEMSFATVRGSGHMPPSDKPSQALLLFQRFVQGKSLPPFSR